MRDGLEKRLLAAREGAKMEGPSQSIVLGRSFVKTALLFALCFLAPNWRASCQSSIQYIYDSAHRLTRAVDSTGVVVEYIYDKAGNITAINRNPVPSGQTVIFGFSVNSGQAG